MAVESPIGGPNDVLQNDILLVAPPLDLLMELLEVKMMNRRLQLLDLLVPASLIVLLVSFACKFFWIIHKIFGFVGEAPVHLLLGVSKK